MDIWDKLLSTVMYLFFFVATLAMLALGVITTGYFFGLGFWAAR